MSTNPVPNKKQPKKWIAISGLYSFGRNAWIKIEYLLSGCQATIRMRVCRLVAISWPEDFREILKWQWEEVLVPCGRAEFCKKAWDY